MTIDTIIQQVYGLPETSMECIRGLISEISFPKGHRIIRSEKIEKSIYFIKKGMVRAYAIHQEQETTFWFGKEGDTVLSMNSYVLNQKGYEDIELLEDSVFFKVDFDALQALYENDIYIANWGRKFAEFELVKTEERLISRQFKSASERYQDLLKQSPELIQRVQLGHIASYLGITQVSLSRIRAERK